MNKYSSSRVGGFDVRKWLFGTAKASLICAIVSSTLALNHTAFAAATLSSERTSGGVYEHILTKKIAKKSIKDVSNSDNGSGTQDASSGDDTTQNSNGSGSQSGDNGGSGETLGQLNQNDGQKKPGGDSHHSNSDGGHSQAPGNNNGDDSNPQPTDDGSNGSGSTTPDKPSGSGNPIGQGSTTGDGDGDSDDAGSQSSGSTGSGYPGGGQGSLPGNFGGVTISPSSPNPGQLVTCTVPYSFDFGSVTLAFKDEHSGQTTTATTSAISNGKFTFTMPTTLVQGDTYSVSVLINGLSFYALSLTIPVDPGHQLPESPYAIIFPVILLGGFALSRRFQKSRKSRSEA